MLQDSTVRWYSSPPVRATACPGVEPLLAHGGDPLRPACVELASRLRSRETELREAVLTHVSSAGADAGGDAQPAQGLRETIGACMEHGLTSIERGAQWPVPVPPAVGAQARRAASGGASLPAVLSRCVTGYTVAWSVVLSEVADHDFPAEQRFALLQQASAVMGSLLARVQAEIANAHLSIARRVRSHAQRREEIVHRLLAEKPVPGGELAELGYDLHGWHLGAVATGSGAARAVRSIAARLGCELLVAHRGEAVWAWLGGRRRRLAFADVERALPAGESAGVSLALGEPSRGVEGWRQTHREAGDALLVARCRPRRLTRYLDVAPDATALRDEALGDALIETFLAPLDRMRVGGRTARGTVRALLDSGHNVSSAASALAVDRSTVHRRRTEIERRLGCRLHERQVEIELALRIDDLRERRVSIDAAHPLGRGKPES
jgi:diguanylate cyclase with GGDEF domain/PucR-like helix-turn-helix protein